MKPTPIVLSSEVVHAVRTAYYGAPVHSKHTYYLEIVEDGKGTGKFIKLQSDHELNIQAFQGIDFSAE